MVFYFRGVSFTSFVGVRMISSAAANDRPADLLVAPSQCAVLNSVAVSKNR
jgi:hypothetical protein